VVRVHRPRLNRVGPKNARRLGLKINMGRWPTDDELKAVLTGRGVVPVRLERGSDD
jgi:hypothetical protein